MKIFIGIILLIAGVSLISLMISSTARLPIEKYKWKQAKIQNYEIETDYYSPWHFQTYIFVVRNG